MALFPTYCNLVCRLNFVFLPTNEGQPELHSAPHERERLGREATFCHVLFVHDLDTDRRNHHRNEWMNSQHRLPTPLLRVQEVVLYLNFNHIKSIEPIFNLLNHVP